MRKRSNKALKNKEICKVAIPFRATTKNINKVTNCRSYLEVFFKESVLKKFAKFTGKHLCWGLSFKKKLQYFKQENFTKFLRAVILCNIHERLLLKLLQILITSTKFKTLFLKSVDNLLDTRK